LDRNGYRWPAVVAPRMPAGLIALALASFALGTAEFVIAGLLPNVAHDLSVSSGTAGLLVTTYAIGVIVGAPVVTSALSRYPPKRAVVGPVAVFAGVNLLFLERPKQRHGPKVSDVGSQ
jgi:MFS transporter, DHA1 family, inner membrane transport protein